MVQKHGHRAVWWKAHRLAKPIFGIRKHLVFPRQLLDRDIFRGYWKRSANIPDVNRWEKLMNGVRVSEDRYALVEEDGAMFKIDWKMYCQRLETELQAARDNLPQFKVSIRAAPAAWKKLEVDIALLRGLSLREAMAQCKLSSRKGHYICYRALEMAQQGAEGKGLDKEKLRILSVNVMRGFTDKQVDIRSKGYYSWKTKRSSNLVLTVVEDPEMVLPDRTAVPYASVLSLRRAGLRDEPTVLDVPAITADGI
jgi:ribosomal protein L22